MPKLAAAQYVADLHSADVNEMPGFRIGCEVQKKFAMSGRGKNVGNAFAGQCAAFLVHQDFERSPRVLAIGRGHKTNVAELRHMPALGAVAAAGRRRAFGVVEFFPVVAQVEPDARCWRLGETPR